MESINHSIKTLQCVNHNANKQRVYRYATVIVRRTDHTVLVGPLAGSEQNRTGQELPRQENQRY